MLLPALAEQVVSAEQERDASVLALSTLHFHTDKADPKPILAKSWKPADGKDRCEHARPGVIVLGRRAGHVPAGLHRQEGVREALGSSEGDRLRIRREDDGRAGRRSDVSRRRRGRSSEPRRNGGGPNSVRELFGSSQSARRSSDGRRCCFDSCSRTSGRTNCSSTCSASLTGLAAKRYPQAIAVALALRHSWQRDDLVTFSKRLGVKVTSKDLADTPTSTNARSDAAERAVGPTAQDAEEGISLGTRRAAHGHSRGRR